MPVAFTSEQQKVIDLRGSNILVSAAAGSGKTAVLVERIVKMVCDGAQEPEGDSGQSAAAGSSAGAARPPVDIDRLLVVTFTNAAAAEMRERIGAGIAARLALHPESEHIQRQAALLHNAQITTIDSFCLFLLRNHFNEIGLDPAFRIADEGEIKLMQQDVLKQLLEDAYASGSEAFRYCVEYFCPGGKESVLEQHILNLSRYASAFPWPEEWLEERREDYGAETVEQLCESGCGRYLTGHLAAMVQGWIQKMERVQRLCLEPDGPYMYGELVESELEKLEKLSECDSLAEYEVKLPAVQFGRLSAKKDDSVDPAKRELAAALRAEVKKSVQGEAARFFATPLELAVSQSLSCREPISTLIDLVQDFRKRMGQRKQEKKVIDFTDMEHFALDILLTREEGEIRPSSVAREYRQHFAEILTDEYQDSNLVQEILLSAVSGEEEGSFNRFMVGDVKQSIYKFRLARPELFLEKYHTYSPCLPEQTAAPRDSEPKGDAEQSAAAGSSAGAARQPGAVRIDLSKNFRSREQVVEAVNDVFSRLMSERTGGLVYDDRAALYPGAVYPENVGNECELLLAEKPSGESEFSQKQAEARVIAAKIKKLREHFRVTDKVSGELRPAAYSDMVILLRTTSGWDEEFKAILEEEGIPVYITSKTGYFGATEVQELLQLLRVLDNPRQDIPLFGVMRSVFGGFTEEEIALIRSGSRRGTLYEAAERYGAGADAEQGQEEPCVEELREKTADFLRSINEYRRCTVYMPVRELLTKLITDYDYLNYVTALPAGGKRRANVEMLLTRASDFEKTSYFGLFHFIRYMEQLEKYDVDYGEAELLDENADVVRIMSIHKSKGLEFPVVFVSGLDKRFNMQDANQSLILDMDLGLATDYVDPVRRLKNKTLRRNVLARKLREDSLAEELRVLYVAMTRAREKLILTAVTEKAGERWDKAREYGGDRLLYSDFIESGSYLDFLMPVIGDTHIEVTIVGEEDLAALTFEEQLEMGDRVRRLEQADVLADREAAERLRERLHTRYAYENLAGLYTKTTVSELKIAVMADRDEAAYHEFEEREVQPYIPAFRREEEKITGTVRGNAYHRVMELLEFERLLGRGIPAKEGEDAGLTCFEDYLACVKTPEAEERLRDFLQEESESRRLRPEYAQAVNRKKILRFLETELAYRMWRAERQGRLYREQPFVMGVSAAKLGEGFPSTEKVLIQGIIDVFFEEEDGIVLLDYKTDSISSLKELTRRYETQLEHYGEAVTRLTGRPVKEKILYSFHLEQYG